VVIGSRSRERIDSALTTLPAGVIGHPVDAGDPASVDDFFERVGELDHLVYTAADVMATCFVDDFTADAFASFMRLRVVGAIHAVRAAVPRIKPHGSLTLISGTAAYRPGPGWMLGAMASGASISLMRTLALELAPLRVNVVAPGVVRSPLWDGMPEGDRQAMYDGLATLPAGRVAEVEDVARAFVALMEQDYVTGTVSIVDGGTLLV
jgi:NAD(P)-dependent dehydrogenase (short-subunit alcohol dehydrogenase family)